MAKKFITYRKGGQVGASVYAGEIHRSDCLVQAAKQSPFFEEMLDENKMPIGLMVFNPMRSEVESSNPEVDVYDPSTLKDSDVPKGATVRVWAPKGSEEG